MSQPATTSTPSAEAPSPPDDPEPSGTQPPTDPPEPGLPSAPRRPPGPNLTLVAILVGIGAVLFLSIGTFALLRSDDPGGTASTTDDDGWAGVLLGEPTPRPDFTLTDTEGQPFDFRERTQGQLTMLFFGYTNCPDICPIQMATLARALEEPGTPDPTVVFVTTDPERDTPEHLRSWLDGFDPEFIGLSGTPEETAAAEEAAKIAPSMRLPDEPGEPVDEDAEEYLVGHASQVLAFTPDDQAHVAYPTGTRMQDWLSDLPRLAEEFPATDVTAHNAWSSATTDVAAVYATIDNPGDPDTVVDITSPAAQTVSVMEESGAHGSHDGDRSSRTELPEGTTTFEPGKAHIMLEDFTEPPKPGDVIELTLELENGPPLTVQAEVLDWDEVVDRLDT